MSYIYKKTLHKRQDEDGTDNMSAGFCTSYYDIVNRDLRNIHGGFPPSDIKFRTTIYHRGIDIYDRLRDQRTRPNIRFYPRKHLEYLEPYDICIPKAPAFRILSKEEIDKLVYRLNMRQDRTRSRRFQLQDQHPKRSQIRSAPASTSRRTEASISQTYPKEPEVTSKLHMAAIVERLYKGHTHQSELRKREPVFPKRCKSAPVTAEKSK